MRCDETRMLLPALAADRLDATTTNEVHTHLATCPLCRRRLASVLDDIAQPQAGAAPYIGVAQPPTLNDLQTANRRIDGSADVTSPIQMPKQRPAMDSNEPYTSHPPASSPVPPRKQGPKRGKWAIIGASAFGVVFMIVLIFAFDPGDDGPSGETLEVSPDLARKIGPPNIGGSPELEVREVVESIEGAAYEYFDKNGTFIQFFARQVKPLPNGTVAVDYPVARIHLKQLDTVLQIQSESGEVNAPGDELRSGHFEGNVVITLFDRANDNEGSPPVDLNVFASPDIAMQLFMEEVNFDVEIGVLTSDQVVHLTGPAFDFRGRGLSMSFNERQQRIDRLIITHGDRLRFNADRVGDLNDRNGDNEDSTAPGQANEEGRKPVKPRIAANENDLQLYRATLKDHVRVTSPEARINGDRLEVLFALSSSGREQMLDNIGGSSRHERGNAVAPRLTSGFAASLLTLAGQVNASPGTAPPAAAPKQTIYDAPKSRSLLPVNPADDVIVEWQGPMELLPIEEKENVPIASKHDVHVTIIGKPVTIHGVDNEVITAERVTYRAENETIILHGSAAAPLKIDSPELGELICEEQLVIDNLNGIGVINGKGSLRTRPSTKIIGEDSKEKDQRLPEELVMTWTDRVDLTFYTKKSNDEGGKSKLVNLKTATFFGNVTANAPNEFEMQAQSFGLALGEPQGGKQAVEGIIATGDARFWARLDQEDGEELAIAGDDVRVEFDTDKNGDPQPSRLFANGHVVAEQKGSKINADLLDVSLAMVPDPLKIGAAESQEKLQVVAMRAERNVTVDLVDQGDRIVIHADRMVGHVERNQLEIFGTADQPAEVFHPEGMISGGQLVMHETDGTLEVTGPGYAIFSIKDEAAAATKSAAANSEPAQFRADPQNQLRINWSQSMLFSDKDGRAEFIGDVVAEGRNDANTTHIEGEEMRLSFAEAPLEVKENQPAGLAQEAVGQPGDGLVGRLRGGDKQLQQVLIIGNAVFLAENWAREPDKDLQTRVQLNGATIVFNNVEETVVVDGVGKMLVQDERKDEDKAQTAITTRANPANPAVAFTGHGATLFTWEGSLLLDAKASDMRINGEVQMYHRPASDEPVMRLHCDQLIADLDKDGGLAGWLEKEGPQPRVNHVVATGGVTVVREELTIVTDNLVFTGDNGIGDEEPDTIVLFANDNRLSQISDDNQPTPITAQKFRWNLKTDKLEIIRPSGTRVPIKR